MLQALPFLTHQAKQQLMEPCRTLLQKHIQGALEENVELLSDSGRDRMFNGVSALFSKIYTVLASEAELALIANKEVSW
jgi:hypothetical protein